MMKELEKKAPALEKTGQDGASAEKSFGRGFLLAKDNLRWGGN